MYSKPQKLMAEFFGTFALVFFGAGSICADQFVHGAGQTGPGQLGIALAHGLAFAVMVIAVGHISGGHFNPAITIGYWVTRRMSTFDTVAYWIAQLVGAIVAAYVLRLIVPEDSWRSVALGAPILARDLSRGTGMLAEGLMAFFLVLVVFATTVDERGAGGKIAGFATGLTITMGMLFGGPLTGASMNPARAFGPELAAHHWPNMGIYWVGPLAGGVVAGWIYDSLLLKKS